MTSLPVCGAAQQVERLVSALRDAGAEVAAVTELDDMPAECGKAGEGTFDPYVQLPSTFRMRGATVIERVRAFCADGVLARLPPMTAAVPTPRSDARVIFVLGELPAEVKAGDDRDARLSLARVLAQAARAGAPDTAFTVQVLDFDTPLERLVGAAPGTAVAPTSLLESLSDLTYADWRAEVLGRVALDT